MTLALYRGDLLALTHEWTNLHDDELKRRAVRAAGDKDVQELVSLTTAYLAHQGGSGVLTSGRTVEAGKTYKVAGWASVNEQQGKPVWEVFARHLRSGKIPEKRGAGVILKGVDDNPGIAAQQ